MRDREMLLDTGAKILAMAGKGGTGKTTLSALLIKYLVESFLVKFKIIPAIIELPIKEDPP